MLLGDCSSLRVAYCMLSVGCYVVFGMCCCCFCCSCSLFGVCCLLFVGCVLFVTCCLLLIGVQCASFVLRGSFVC